MKLSLKDLLKLISPYMTTIASAIALYASFQTRLGVLEYRTDAIEERSAGLQKILMFVRNLS